jgi:peroxiredoxin Q/BCP
MPAVEGKAAPSFTLQNQDGETVRLKDFAGRRLVVFFYPKAFTPGCTTEACDFRDSAAPLQKAGIAVVGVSPDPVARLADFKREHALPYPLLADPEHQVAERYGAWGTKKNYGREYEGIIRSTYVIGPDGKIEKVYPNVRAKGHVARLRKDLLDG